MIASGICASDISTIKGINPMATYPRIPGHESIGEIIATKGTTNFEIGDYVTVFPGKGCNKCTNCKKQLKNAKNAKTCKQIQINAKRSKKCEGEYLPKYLNICRQKGKKIGYVCEPVYKIKLTSESL